MGEAAAVGLSLVILQFLDYGQRTFTRFQDLQSKLGDIPKCFRVIKNTLPLLINALRRTQRQAETGKFSIDVEDALKPIIWDCNELIQELDGVINKLLPRVGDSKLKLGKKAWSSVAKDGEIKRIAASLRHYVQTLTYHHVIGTIDLPCSNGTHKPAFTIPFSKDKNFVGREEILAKIDHILCETQHVALSGIGGIGKSQIAIESGHRFQIKHPDSHVIWIHASSAARLRLSYSKAAEALQLLGKENPRRGYDGVETDVVALVNEFLSKERTRPWLLIVDNFDDCSAISECPYEIPANAAQALQLPESPLGHFILTTRDKAIGDRIFGPAFSLVVPPMSFAESTALLRGQPICQGAGSLLEIKLLKLLECLPLAISQATAYCCQNNISLEDYVNMLQKNTSDWQRLLDKDLGDRRRDKDNPCSVSRTMMLSFESIRKQNKLATDLLSLMAVLDRQGIPKDLLGRECENDVELSSALGTLQAFSLVIPSKNGAAFDMHRLVHLAAQSWLHMQGTIREYQRKALKILSQGFPRGHYGNWAACEILLPHTIVVSQYVFKEDDESLQELATLLNNHGVLDQRQGRYQASAEKLKRALRYRKRTLGPDHPETLHSMANLASTHRSLGQWQDAEQLDAYVVGKSYEILESEHPTRLISMAGLATTYRDCGRCSEAEELQLKVIAVNKNKNLQDNHPLTISSMSSLAAIYKKQGRWEEAQRLQEKVKTTSFTALGPEHPDSLSSALSLASIKRKRGFCAEAEELELEVIKINSRLYGLEHIDTLSGMANLAATYRHQSRWNEAERIDAQAVQISRKILGHEHPNTVVTMANLTLDYLIQRKRGRAEKLAVKVVYLSKKVLGNDHPDTLTSMGNLACLYRSQGRFLDAEELELQVLDYNQRMFKKNHPDALSCLSNLALTYMYQGRWSQAKRINITVLKMRMRILGLNHRDTICSMVNLAATYRNEGLLTRAERLGKYVLGTYRKLLGDAHPDTLTAMLDLAGTHMYQSRWAEAIELNEKAVELGRNTLGSEHPDVLMCMANLVAAYRHLERLEEAEQLELEVFEASERVLGPTHPDTVACLDGLATTCRMQGRWSDAARWQKKLIAVKKLMATKTTDDLDDEFGDDW